MSNETLTERIRRLKRAGYTRLEAEKSASRWLAYSNRPEIIKEIIAEVYLPPFEDDLGDVNMSNPNEVFYWPIKPGIQYSYGHTRTRVARGHVDYINQNSRAYKRDFNRLCKIIFV